MNLIFNKVSHFFHTLVCRENTFDDNENVSMDMFKIIIGHNCVCGCCFTCQFSKPRR